MGKQGKGILQKGMDWFLKAGMGAKASVIAGAAVVVCAAASGILLLTLPSDEPVMNSSVASGESVPDESGVPDGNSSEEESSEPSSEPESSEPESSEPDVPSSEASSVAASSAPASSQPASSAASSRAASSAPASSVASVAASSAPASSGAAAGANGLPTGYQDKFADAYKQNKSVVGHISLSGTNLNYYVAQYSNNTYYTNHDFNKQSFAWGNPYLDFRCSIEPAKRYDNIVIYAHSDDKKQLQFAPIKQYEELEFYQQHPTINFNTVYNDEVYKVVGFFAENVDMPNSFLYWQPESLVFQNETAYNTFVNEVKARSYITMPVDTQYGDKFITLSTCVSVSTSHSRYVLVARRVRDGESASVDTSLAVKNASQKPPSGELN